MSHNPGTIHGETGPQGLDWAAPATLHRADDGGGVLDALKAVRHGELADLVRYIALLPEAERTQYVIELTGNSRLTAQEVTALYARPDFPHAQ